jgi:probable rRNA maturation factor
MNQVDISAYGISPPPWSDAAETFILRVLEELGIDNWDLSAVFCDDAFIKRLNAEYRGKDEPTDVLSFCMGTAYTGDDAEGKRCQSGDIVISVETLKENAETFRVTEDEELRRLLIHGILHLNGMDHKTNDEKEPMLEYQEDLLDKLAGERILS